jgi:hypothetical protein
MIDLPKKSRPEDSGLKRFVSTAKTAFLEAPAIFFEPLLGLLRWIKKDPEKKKSALLDHEIGTRKVRGS